MKDELLVMRLVPAKREEVFDYFVRPELLESWSYPEGMSLRVPLFEARRGGQYRLEYSNPEGLYECFGTITSFEPGTKLAQIERLIGPDGKIIFSELETVTTFSSKPGGTFITVVQRGFTDERKAVECERLWNLCLERLASILSGRSFAQAQM